MQAQSTPYAHFIGIRYMPHLELDLEALLFCATEPLRIEEMEHALSLHYVLERPAKEEIVTALAALQAKHEEGHSALHLVETGGGYLLLTRSEFHPLIQSWQGQQNRKRLSVAALETLSIVAYKQPVTKSDIDQLRGVSSDYALQKLLEKELVSTAGRANTPGKPMLYVTAPKMLDYLGINSLEELPKLRDFKQMDSDLGEAAPEDELH